MKRLVMIAGAVAAVAGAASTVQAQQTYTFGPSVGLQPSNVGTITLTQVNPTTVNVFVDLLSGYGFLNTGGPHTPFAFNIAGTEVGVSATFIVPPGGVFTAPNLSLGLLTLSTADGGNTPFGTYGVTINSSTGNGSANAYFGDLEFDLTRPSGLTTNDFVVNTDGYYFSADLTNGSNTGAQAWDTRIASTVPEPATVGLMGTGLLALAGVARRRRQTA
jgi:hypothetical protein